MTGYIPKPPKLTGDPVKDVEILSNHLSELYKTFFFSNRVLQRLDALGAVALNSTEFSNPPTKTQVEALRETVNSIINAAKNTES